MYPSIFYNPNGSFLLEDVFDNKLYRRAYIYLISLIGLSIFVIYFSLIDLDIMIYILILYFCLILPNIFSIMVWDLYHIKNESENNSTIKNSGPTEKKKSKFEDPLHYQMYRRLFLLLLVIISIIMTSIWIVTLFINIEFWSIFNVYFIFYWLILLIASFYIFIFLSNKIGEYEVGIKTKIKRKLVRRQFLREIKWNYEELNNLSKKFEEKETKEIRNYFIKIESKYSDLLEEDFYDIEVLEALEILKNKFEKKLKSHRSLRRRNVNSPIHPSTI